jgi:hypothetical protein
MAKTIKKTTSFAFRMENNVYKNLCEFAEKEKITKTKIVNDALKRYIAETTDESKKEIYLSNAEKKITSSFEKLTNDVINSMLQLKKSIDRIGDIVAKLEFDTARNSYLTLHLIKQLDKEVKEVNISQLIENANQSAIRRLKEREKEVNKNAD